jgi:hypothetical protein
MSGTLRVLWTIRTSTTTPSPILRCSRCDQPRAFESSGRFRLNANGKRLDAWLIYRCAACGAAWNRTIFERRQRSEIDDAVLEALQGNDPVLAEQVARDATGLRRWTTRLAEGDGGTIAVDKAVLAHGGGDVGRLAIDLVLAVGTTVRCDRLLAAGLGLSRGSVAALADAGRIAVDHSARKPLARPLRQGSSITIDVAGLAGAAALVKGATGT